MRKTQGPGRKSRADQKVLVCFTQQEYDDLHELLGVTDFKTMSGLIRQLIEGKRVVARYPYTTHEKQLEQVAAIKKEIQFLGTEMDKLARQLYTPQSLDSMIAIGEMMAILYEMACVAFAPLEVIIAEISKKWSAELDKIES